MVPQGRRYYINYNYLDQDSLDEMIYAFKKLYRNINLSNSEYFYERTLSLPMHIDLTKKNINYILETINKYINENK